MKTTGILLNKNNKMHLFTVLMRFVKGVSSQEDRDSVRSRESTD